MILVGTLGCGQVHKHGLGIAAGDDHSPRSDDGLEHYPVPTPLSWYGTIPECAVPLMQLRDNIIVYHVKVYQPIYIIVKIYRPKYGIISTKTNPECEFISTVRAIKHKVLHILSLCSICYHIPIVYSAIHMENSLIANNNV